jgi:hypothetical protein
MTKMKSRAASAAVLFDVIYEDGGRTSNRRIPIGVVNELDRDAVRRHVEAQDLQIAERSGVPPRRILKIMRSEI